MHVHELEHQTSDADWSNDPNNRRNITGYLYYCRGAIPGAARDRLLLRFLQLKEDQP